MFGGRMSGEADRVQLGRNQPIRSHGSRVAEKACHPGQGRPGRCLQESQTPGARTLDTRP